MPPMIQCLIWINRVNRIGIRCQRFEHLLVAYSVSLGDTIRSLEEIVLLKADDLVGLLPQGKKASGSAPRDSEQQSPGRATASGP
jgi:hypothetical protein